MSCDVALYRASGQLDVVARRLDTAMGRVACEIELTRSKLVATNPHVISRKSVRDTSRVPSNTAHVLLGLTSATVRGHDQNVCRSTKRDECTQRQSSALCATVMTSGRFKQGMRLLALRTEDKSDDRRHRS